MSFSELFNSVMQVASALSDPYLSFAAALNGLAGPLHGLANQVRGRLFSNSYFFFPFIYIIIICNALMIVMDLILTLPFPLKPFTFNLSKSGKHILVEKQRVLRVFFGFIHYN